MTSLADEYYVSKMTSSVVIIPVDGLDIKNKSEIDRIDLLVETKVKAIVSKLKDSHEKFNDSDFGPTEKDIDGAISFYGLPPISKGGDNKGTTTTTKPEPAGSKYPDPKTLKWERPQYDDTQFSAKTESLETKKEDSDEEEEEEDYGYGDMDEDEKIWCKHGRLFVDGSSSGDAIQGTLGDCWFLSALSVLGAKEDLLDKVFWKRDAFKEYGLYVLRFFKDCSIIYVIIDDKLPVKRKDGRLIFGMNKDPNELWVPLVEKAYAKLHGCYKALIGGFVHYGVADMTGYCPRLIVLKEGLVGYAQKFTKEDIWSLLKQYVSKDWDCLLGCSIQSNAKDSKEENVGNGLLNGHAYSFLGLGEVNLGKEKIKLVKLRNPWGRGEWEGPYGDRSDEREQFTKEIDEVFNKNERKQEQIDINFNDGTFLMPYDAWFERFTNLFIAINFPKTWSCKKTQGHWSGDQGGNREQGTWISNPKVKFKLEKEDGMGDEEYRQVFIGIYIKDTRLSMGADYYKDPLYVNPIAFDIVTESELKPGAKKEFIPFSKSITGGLEKVPQAPYNYGATQIDVFLKVGVEYYLVPSLYKRLQPGTFFFNVHANCKNFQLEGTLAVNEAQKPMILSAKPQSGDQNVPVDQKILPMSVGQFYDKKEQLRERIVSEAKRLNLTIAHLKNKFNDTDNNLSISTFKRRMLEIGFMLADFPDADLVVLDTDGDGTISKSEFITFFSKGLEFSELTAVGPAPEPPKDDLLFKVPDLSGELTVNVTSARYLRNTTTWFNSKEVSDGLDNLNTPKVDSKIVTNNNSATVISTDKNTPSSTIANKDLSIKPDSLSRKYIKYDPEASKLYMSKKQERIKQLKETFKNAKKITEPTQTDNSKSNNFNTTQVLNSPNTTPLNSPGPTTLTLGNLTAHNDTFKSKGGVNLQPTVAKTAITGMSVTKQKIIEQAGLSAAIKLHTDPALQIAEKNRTKSLSEYREAKKNKQQFSVLDGTIIIDDTKKVKAEEGALRKKFGASSAKQTKRNIWKDRDAMKLLGLTDEDIPKFDKTAVRQPTIIPDATKADTSKSSKSSTATTNIGLTPLDTSLIKNAINSIGFTSPSTKKSVIVTAPIVKPIERFKDVTIDIWDYLIDCVITISTSRAQNNLSIEKHRAISLLKGREIPAEKFLLFNPVATPIAAPSKGITPIKQSKGHIATPKSLRHAPGNASVTSVQSISKQKNTIVGAKEQLLKDSKNMLNSFEEVYRRLVLMPVTSRSEMEGDRDSLSGSAASLHSHAYLNSLFCKFDKNNNGLISKDEFKLAMEELNIDVHAEDLDIFFNRFKFENSVSINWKQFVTFFDQQTVSFTNATKKKKKNNIIDLIMELKVILQKTKSDMLKYKAATFDQLLLKSASSTVDSGTTNISNDIDDANGVSFILPDNAIFQNLTTSSLQLQINIDIMRKLNIMIKEEDMERISRIFLYSPTVLMNFVDIPELDLHDVLNKANEKLCDAMNQRIGTQPGTHASNISSHSCIAIAKLWHGIAPDLDSMVSYEDISIYFTNVLLETEAFDTKNDLFRRRSSTVTEPIVNAKLSSDNPKIVKANSSNVIGNKSQSEDLIEELKNLNLTINGVDASTVCRIISDFLICSKWNTPVNSNKESKSSEVMNKPSEQTSVAANAKQSTSIPSISSNTQAIVGTSVPSKVQNSLSFSGLTAYLRDGRINAIERKLKFLIQLEKNNSCPNTYVMVHFYVNKQQDEFIVLAHDPLSGEVYKLGYKEDLKTLPLREKLASMFTEIEKNTNKATTYDLESLYYYNPWDTPIEDAVISEFISRLYIVRSRLYSTSSKLFVAEESKFVDSLKKLLNNSIALPFFSVANNLTVTFEVDENVLKVTDTTQAISLRAYVFSKIRNYKALHNFLINCHSSLNIVLTTYNGGIRETFNWSEMLSHLGNYRNPFFTIQLLPKFLEPEQYFYIPQKTNPNTYSLEDNKNMMNNEQSNIQKSKVDPDGAPHPTWDTTFKFKFQPPQITACIVLSTEVIKIKIDTKDKYVVVLLREAKRRIPKDNNSKDPKCILVTENFRFLTIYDPRSATEYQCGVKPSCNLYQALYYGLFGSTLKPNNKKDDNNISIISENELLLSSNIQVPISDFMNYISEAAENKMIILGPAITPRLEINVYNENGKSQELLGTGQVSVSSILSGTGIADKQWSCLKYRIDNGETSIDAKAGEIELEMSFRGQKEIDAAIEAEKLRKEKKLKQKDSLLMADIDNGDENLNYDNNDKGAELKKEVKTLKKQCEGLSMEKESITLELKKMKDKLQNNNLASTTNSNNTSNELQLIKQENDKLIDEKKNIENEKKKLLLEIEKLKQSKSDITNPSTTNTVAVTSTAINNNNNNEKEKEIENNEKFKKMQEDYKLLLEETMKLREFEKLTKQQMQDNKTNTNTANTSATSLAANATVSKVQAGDGSIINNSEKTNTITAILPIVTSSTASVIEIVHNILKIFITRYEKKLSSQLGSSSNINPLDSLIRILNSYTKPDGTIEPKYFLASLSDLSIDLSIEQVMKIFHELGYVPSKGCLLVSLIIEYLNREITLMLGKKKKNASSSSSTPLRSSLDGINFMNPSTPLIDAKLLSNKNMEDKYNSESFQQVLYQYGKPDGSIDPKSCLEAFHCISFDTITLEHIMKIYNDIGITSKHTTIQIPVLIEYLKKEYPILFGTRKLPHRPISAQSSINMSMNSNNKIDWTQEPLPNNWERRLHTGTNKYVYINHVTHETQWNHPFDHTTKTKTKRNKNNKNNLNITSEDI